MGLKGLQPMSEENKLKTYVMRFSVRYNCIISPLDLNNLGEELVKNGYKLTIPIKVPPSPITRISGQGEIASKEGSIIDVNTDRVIVGVSSSNPVTAINIFQEILEILRLPNIIGIDKIPAFYEIQGRFEFFRIKNPRETLINMRNKMPIFDNIDKILGATTSLYNLRLCSADRPVDSPDFYEIVLEPNMGHPEESFDICVVYRNSNLEVIKQFFNEMPNNIINLVDEIENQ